MYKKEEQTKTTDPVANYAAAQKRVDDESYKSQRKMAEDLAEIRAKKDGPFTISIKNNAGKIESYFAETIWRGIFSLGMLLTKVYSAQFTEGVVIKIMRTPPKKGTVLDQEKLI